MPKDRQRAVLALKHFDRDRVPIFPGTVFVPRNAAERTKLGDAVRDASAHECAIAGVPFDAPAAPESPPGQPEPAGE